MTKWPARLVRESGAARLGNADLPYAVGVMDTRRGYIGERTRPRASEGKTMEMKVSFPGNLAFIEADGRLRPGHEVFNEY